RGAARPRLDAESGGGETAPAGQLWTCGMHPQVIEEKPGLCPICHMDLTPLKVDGDPAAHEHAAPAAGGTAQARPDAASRGRILYWWDPMMSPPYISDKPGVSPMGMELVPVYEEQAGGHPTVIIDPVVVQNMGVRVSPVVEGPLRRSVRVVGYLDEAQPNIHDVNLLVSGWVRRLHANVEGMHVEEGDPLFDLYSPDLQVAIEELIAARQAASAAAAGGIEDDASRSSAAMVRDAAMLKLELWGLPRAQIEALSKLEAAPELITFTSRVTGHVTEKPIVEGAAVMAGERVLRIVDHRVLWMDGRVFEKDLPFVKVGQKARATMASRPGESIEGDVIFMHPHVDAMTRTVQVRLAIPNPDLELRPGMYATMRLEAELAQRAVLVPREAVIDTGERQVAFVAREVGRFEPREVVMGHAAEGGLVQVITGLAPGEPVVVSGQFLLDSESRLREAIQKYLRERQAKAKAPSQAAEEDASVPRGEALDAGAMAKLDALVSAYLAMSESLGAAQTSEEPLDAAGLVEAAGALREALQGMPAEAMAGVVADSASALRDQPLDRQRELFKVLSEAVIGLMERHPPSAGVVGRLYVMHCPMASGDWLQAVEQVRNPYYATSMKRCGEVVRTIEPVASGNATDEDDR
ncbi:MAG: efflux RND transporter periplasmic adaptor subunit, partial [Gemmatimonadetes bacterium]|nr:efflux RND transporter periplasmic adaptor subunit [Gemmatimonadota bacterium]